MNKICNFCNNTKSIESFSKDKSKKDGLSIYCKFCITIKNKTNYYKSPETFREKTRIYIEKNKNNIIYINMKKESNKNYYIKNSNKIKEISKIYRQKNKEIRSQKRKEDHRKNPIPNMIQSSRERAKKKGIEHNLTNTDIIIPKVCPVLGIPIIVGEGKPTPNSPSIDRIDNTKGYTKDNIIIVSWRANDLKRNATIEELEKILVFYKGITKNEQTTTN